MRGANANIMVSWTWTDQFRCRRACDRWANGGNTNVLWWWCEGTETRTDSLSFKARSSPAREKAPHWRASACAWSWRERFQGFVVWTCCENEAKQLKTFVCTCRQSIRDEIKSLGASYFYWTHFLQKKKNCLDLFSSYCILISQRGKEINKTRCRLLPSLCFDILTKPNTTVTTRFHRSTER